MDPMPRPRKPYLHKRVTRHGKVTWYIRRRGERSIRIRADFGTTEFDAAYDAAVAGRAAPKPPVPESGSLAWLWDRYRETGFWTKLKVATRRQRENIMRPVLKESGTASASAITTKHIAAGRDRRAATPAQARNFLDCMRGLFRWAARAGHIASDPTAGVENPPKVTGEGFPVWTEEEIDAYYRRWPLGTRERVWIDVLLYTGLRRGDAVTLGPKHLKNGSITIRTEKSGGDVIVTLPVLPTLAATIAAGPCGEATFICNEYGRSFTKESFGNAFARAARAAGVPKSAHGLRKAGATRAADNGATEAELKAIFGWRGSAMAALYTRAADRKRLANAAAMKMERFFESYAPTPSEGGRTKEKT